MESPSPDRLRWACLYFGFVILHVALALPLQGPIVFGDETAYLAIARLIAGGSPPQLDSYGLHFSSYYGGYSIFLTPAFWLFHTPLASYRSSLFINALLLSAVVPLLGIFARRLFGLDSRRSMIVAAVAGLYPAALLNSNFTWPEALLPAILVLIMVTFHRMVARPGWREASALALLAVFAFAVHPRVAGLVALVLVAYVVLGLRGLLPRPAVYAGLASVVLALPLVLWFEHWQMVRLWGGEGQTLPELRVMSTLWRIKRYLLAIQYGSGQLWYLLAASGGLVLIGGSALLRLARRPKPVDSAAASLTARFILWSIAILALTGLKFLAGGRRLDCVFYGRYNDVFVPLLLTAGLAAGWREPPDSRLHRAWILALLLPAALTCVVLSWPGSLPQLFNAVNVLGIEHWILLVGRPELWSITAISSLLCALLWLGTRFKPAATGLLLGALFLAGALYTESRFVVPMNRAVNQGLELPRALARLGLEREEIAIDKSQHGILYAYYPYAFWLDHASFRFFDPDLAEAPPARLVISEKNWRQARPLGARLVFAEPARDEALWVLPGELQERLARQGVLAP